MDRNLRSYHETISGEFKLLQDRIRNLIGSSHWLTDGEHKETILRRIIRNHMPECYRIGKGFICYPNYLWHGNANDINQRDTSWQLDLIITNINKPTLFKDGELVFITPDAVNCIIEVKTTLDGKDIPRILEKLADEKERIYKFLNQTNTSHSCYAGLFVFDDSNISGEALLKQIQRASEGELNRAIDWISIGPDRFIRFWEDGYSSVRSPVHGPVWHYYKISKLSHAYFVHNVVIEHSLNTPIESEYAWFPIEGTKEKHRRFYIALDSEEPVSFD